MWKSPLLGAPMALSEHEKHMYSRPTVKKLRLYVIPRRHTCTSLACMSTVEGLPHCGSFAVGSFHIIINFGYYIQWPWWATIESHSPWIAVHRGRLTVGLDRIIFSASLVYGIYLHYVNLYTWPDSHIKRWELGPECGWICIDSEFQEMAISTFTMQQEDKCSNVRNAAFD